MFDLDLHDYNQPSQYEIRPPISSISNRPRPAFAIQEENSVPVCYIGQMNERCASCLADMFSGEKIGNHFSACCGNGKIHLQSLREPPQFLKDILIRSPPGWSFFRIHGQVYRAVGHLHNRRPSFAEVYIIDSDQAQQVREQQVEAYHLDYSVLFTLHQILTNVNPYANAYKMMHEVERTVNNSSSRPGFIDICMVFNRDPRVDQRQFSPAKASEIAAVFIGTEGTPSVGTDFTIYPRGRNSNELVTLSHLSPHADPMLYPLLFPHGDPGWNSSLQHSRRTSSFNRTNLREFYAYRIQVRSAEFPQLHLAGRLFLQYLVDAWTKVEENRLQYWCQNQNKLRIEHFQNLYDHVEQINQNNTTGRRIDRRFILPSSFAGSPRAQQQNFQDEMAMVRCTGKPDLFITFTCNPDWQEIKESLLPEQHWMDRPDIVVRVFHLKLKELMKDLTERKIFGEVAGCCFSIEFQKRGLPHAHILLILKEEDKINRPDIIDECISAEIPDCESFPELHRLVKRHMMHGPCGERFPHSPCMVNNQCSKYYPKSFNGETAIHSDGFPLYRRTQNDRRVRIRDFEMDNRWVVPYNPYLLLRYNAHINVEASLTLGSVKYLYKYVFKGLDYASLELSRRQQNGDERDEIKEYRSARYICASEASWRILEKPLTYFSHHIERLAVHLPRMQQVVFVEGAEQSALQSAQNKATTLTAWFDLNQRDLAAHAILYADIPKSYRWVNGSWQRRERTLKPVIGRIYFVSPNESERYCLRLLLFHVSGANSFDDLKRVDGFLYDTFREAALAQGLLQDQEEWVDCLEEAQSYQMPSSLRQLFATICLFGELTRPLDLYERFSDALCEDFLRLNPDDFNYAQQLALKEIDDLLTAHGKCCEEFSLPIAREYSFEQNESPNPSNMINVDEMNSEQRRVYFSIMNAVQNPDYESRIFFIDGPGGSGKTALYNRICWECKNLGIDFIAVAATGLAATLLMDGRTAHSMFKIPLVVDSSTTSSIRVNSKEAERIRKAKIIIYDEATMVRWEVINCVKSLCEDVCCNNEPFGGKVIVLGGDFRQCLPVIPHGTRAEVVNATLIMSSLSSLFEKISLQRNMRASHDQEYCDWITEIGNGLSKEVVIPSFLISRNSLISEIFGDVQSEYLNIDWMRFRCILTPKNEDALKVNEKVLARLPGETKTYYSADKIQSDEDTARFYFPPEVIESFTPSGLPTHTLNLKKGCIVMLLRNLAPNKGLCNGTRLVVVGFERTFIRCKRLSDSEEEIFIPRINLKHTADSRLPFTLSRRQFPVRLSYAMTINKSQGQTFDKVGLLLSTTVFEHGQLYVALSRVKNRNSVLIKVNQTRDQGFSNEKGKNYTKNIVYREVLQNL